MGATHGGARQRPRVVREGLKWGLRTIRTLTLFVLAEPIWMLMPFAGFLYGAVFPMEALGRNPSTAWLTHFIFPVLTGGWLGPALIGLGLVVFAVGFAQIYSAKLFRWGMVTGGLYRFIRHPQYLAFALLGAGSLLAWGRAITFVATFLMMFLYRYLARSEERTCLRLFGEAYEKYRERTSFILPGDRHLRPLRRWLPRLGLPAPVRVAGALALTLGICFSLMWLINTVKASVQTVPHLTAIVPLPSRPAATPTADPASVADRAKSATLVLVHAPLLRTRLDPPFAKELLDRLAESGALREQLRSSGAGGEVVAVAFPTPGQNWYREHHGRPQVRFFVMLARLRGGADVAQLFRPGGRELRSAFLAQMDLKIERGSDSVTEIRPVGPRRDLEERWRFFLSGVGEEGGYPQGR